MRKINLLTVGALSIIALSQVTPALANEKTDNISNQIQQGEKSYSDIQSKIRSNDEQIVKSKNQLSKLNKENDELKTEIADLKTSISKQMRSMQTSSVGLPSIINSIISSESITEAVTKISNINTLQDAQDNMMKELQDKEQQSKDNIDRINKEQAKLEKARKDNQGKSDELQKTLGDLQNQLVSAQKEEKEAKEKAALEAKMKAIKLAQETEAMNAKIKASNLKSSTSSGSVNTNISGDLSSHVKYDPKVYGLTDDGSAKGWYGQWYFGQSPAGQCTEFSSSMLYAVYGLENKMGNGQDIVGVLQSKFGKSKVSTSTPTSGAIASVPGGAEGSTPGAGHTYFVEDVLEDGSVLIAEQNSQFSGNYIGKPYTYNFRIIPKSTYGSDGTTFYKPNVDAKKPSK